MAKVSRREFIRRAGLGAAAGTMAWGLGSSFQGHSRVFGAGSSSRRPNILVIMADEHNAGVLGCYGNRLVQTPNLDGLAQRGVAFDSAYTNSPLCVPCRLSFTSGKYISRVGGWNNDCWLPRPDYPSLPAALNAAGYESFLCGKMHYDATCRYGFTEIGQDSTNRGHMTGQGGRRAADDLKPQPGLSERFADFHQGDGPIEKHDRRVTDDSVAFLKERKAGQKPFFLLTGYLAPHFPLTVPEELWGHYRGKIELPRIPAGHLEQQPLNYKHLRIGFNVEDTPLEIVRSGRELYYGLTEWLDVEVGKVLRALGDSEVADNTVVIYTADHGENMGEHGLWWKNSMYQHSARVPLIVSWPAHWRGGQRRTEACSLVDVVQTIAELGGADIPGDWDGDSLRPWLDDPAARWKDRAVSEYYAHNIASGYAMLRQDRFKYVYHTAPDSKHPAQRELYDLTADPGEYVNLANEPGQRERIARLHDALVQELGEDPERTELRCRKDYARGYGRAPRASRNPVG
ncbi:MAG TPA: sulfatase-like hydrolase/transferase [Armatimonadota bacterium]|nr:sulfatase-like hydrolase/transferase [Armatimonadota bacterium]